MNRIQTLITILAFIITIAACNKNLNQPIYDTQTTSSVSTTADVSMLLQGTYGIFQNLDFYKEGLLKLLILPADDFTSNSAQFQIFNQRTFDATSPAIQAVYSDYYNVINNCNNIIATLPTLKLAMSKDSTFVSDSLNHLHQDAEARFFRAFCYFDLVRLFGAVPLRTQPTNINSNFYISRTIIDIIYKQIFTDLKIASNEYHLQVVQPKTATQKLSYSYVKVSKTVSFRTLSDGVGLTNESAVQSLQALANLTYANYLDRNGGNALPYYTNADTYADSVIKFGGYSLVTKYADLWNVDNESSNYGAEIIWGIRFTRDAGGSSSASVGSSYASRFSPSTMGGVCGNTTKNSNGNLGSGSGTFRVEPWFYNYYVTNSDYTIDDRIGATFMTTWPKNIGSGSMYVSYPNYPTYSGTVNYVAKVLIDSLPSPEPFIRKYQDHNGLDAADNENDLYIFRLSEIYLIQAEAENEINGGPTTKAISDFNLLRSRANNPKVISSLDVNAFRKKIFDERGLEFLGECKRWFDLVRMKGPDGTGTMYQYQFDNYLKNNVQAGLPFADSTQKIWITTAPKGGLTDPYSIGPKATPFSLKFLLFPIPQKEIDENALLLPNNAGW